MGALDGGSQAEVLEALRGVLAKHLASSSTPATAVPGLARQLRDVVAELERLKPSEESPVDELAKRRRNRRANIQADATGGQ